MVARTAQRNGDSPTEVADVDAAAVPVSIRSDVAQACRLVWLNVPPAEMARFLPTTEALIANDRIAVLTELERALGISADE